MAAGAFLLIRRGLFAVRGLAALLLGLFPLLLTQRVVLLVLGVDLAFGGLIGGARGDRRVLRIRLRCGFGEGARRSPRRA